MPIATSPNLQAPSSILRRALSRSSPFVAAALTTFPFSTSSTIPSISLPIYIPGKLNVITPSTPSSTGEVNTSPSGKFTCPSQFIHFLPSMFTLISVPSEINCNSFLVSRNLTHLSCSALILFHSATGSLDSSRPAP